MEVVPTTTTRIVTQTTTPITKIIIMKVPVPETEVTKTVRKQMKDRKTSPILEIVKTKLTMTKRMGRHGSQQNQLKKTKLMTLKWLMKLIIQSLNPSRENRVSTDRALI